MLSPFDRLTTTMTVSQPMAWSIPRGRLTLAATCLLAVSIGAPGMRDESSVSTHGDAAKQLMNGVFLADLIRDRPFGSVDQVVEYTQLYYARYPALSLGHHPPLLAVAEAAVLAVFGASMAAARAVQFTAFVSAVALLYLLVHERVGWRAGFWPPVASPRARRSSCSGDRSCPK